MAQSANTSTILTSDDGRPLVLVGPPRAMRGELHVQNLTERKVIVERPRLTPIRPQARQRARRKAAAETETPTEPSLPDAPLALRRIIVRPGHSRPVPIALTLDPRTPPGTYHAALDVDGEHREVVMYVTEHLAISIDPPEIVIPNHPGEKVQKIVVLKNGGNVPLRLRNIGPIVIDEELAQCRALRGALSDVGETMETMNDFIAALGHRLHAIYETSILRIQNQDTMIAPGETKGITLSITLPEKLERRSRYYGNVPISTATLTVVIVPS